MIAPRLRHGLMIWVAHPLLLNGSCRSGAREDASSPVASARAPVVTVGAPTPSQARPAEAPPSSGEAAAPSNVLRVERRGETTAYFIGSAPESEPGSPEPPLSYGVERLEFAFAGDPRRYPFEPEGELFFSDHRFDIFSPSGDHVALLQDHQGPYHLVATARLKAYLTGRAPPDDVAQFALNTDDPTLREAGFSGIALVLGNLRWISNREVEFEASGENVFVVRHELGGATRVVARRERR